jgi:hypothetical protein
VQAALAALRGQVLATGPNGEKHTPSTAANLSAD